MDAPGRALEHIPGGPRGEQDAMASSEDIAAAAIGCFESLCP
tara:strand:- start:471 stop:596 length:126 start_codon:yes stop_codon:yes gene_type:complete